MLSFFLDQNMTKPVSARSPMKFMVPEDGGTKQLTLYLGDPYFANCEVAAAIGDNTLSLTQTEEFPTAGQALIGAMTISYTGKTAKTLTGVTGISAAVAQNAKITPKATWVPFDIVKVIPPNHGNEWKVALKRNDQTGFGFFGTPIIFVDANVPVGATPLVFQVQVQVGPGAPQEFDSWSLSGSSFMQQQLSALRAPTADDVFIQPQANGAINRRNQGLPMRMRLLSGDRRVETKLPGFVIGEYRWRDEATSNAQKLVPARWDLDVDLIGRDKFTSGIGHADDLKPLSLVETEDSIQLNVEAGHYFVGPERYYFPVDPIIEFAPAKEVIQLDSKPAVTTPVFVGIWRRDSMGFYRKDTEYRYKLDWTDEGAFQFKLDRKTNQLMLKTLPAMRKVFVAALTNHTNQVVELGIYPIDRISRLYVERAGGTVIPVTDFNYDGEVGTLTFTNPTGSLVGDIVYADCQPAVAIVYDRKQVAERTLECELNPAFSGLTSGYVYLQHKRPGVSRLDVSCDKPILPAVGNFKVFGPVYTGGDYAMVRIAAYDLGGSPVPGARLKVVPVNGQFTGRINYADPLAETVEITTGGDGIATCIYTPAPYIGLFVPGASTTTIANDTLVLPSPVPLVQIWSGTEWLVSSYSVASNNGLFGKVGANPQAGEIAWTFSGTPGQADYRTNGALTLINFKPIAALDVNGNDAKTTGLDVVKLVYGQALPTASVAAYRVAPAPTDRFFFRTDDDQLDSPILLLKLAVPSPSEIPSPWLVLDDVTNGRLQQFRLGSLQIF